MYYYARINTSILVRNSNNQLTDTFLRGDQHQLWGFGSNKRVLDVSAKLPGVELKAEERDFSSVSNEPEADFRELAAAALHNAGIDTEE